MLADYISTHGLRVFLSVPHHIWVQQGSVLRYRRLCLCVKHVQVPAERFKFTDPLLVPYLSKNAESLKQKVHLASGASSVFSFYMLWAGLPTVGFAATQAFASYEIKMSKNNGTNAMNRTGEESEVEVTALRPDMILGYFLLFTSPLCWMIMTGWFPAEGIYMNYDKQVTELWISEYADDVLRTLVDDRVPPKERLERLSMLYQRRGKWLSQSLANHINPFHTYVPCSHLQLSIVHRVAFSGCIRGLNNVDNAILAPFCPNSAWRFSCFNVLQGSSFTL